MLGNKSNVTSRGKVIPWPMASRWHCSLSVTLAVLSRIQGSIYMMSLVNDDINSIHCYMFGLTVIKHMLNCEMSSLLQSNK